MPFLGDTRRLGIEGQRIEAGQIERARSATRRDLAGHSGRIGEGEPEDAAGEELAVAMGKLGGELGFANAAKASRGGDLTDRGSAAPFHCCC